MFSGSIIDAYILEKNLKVSRRESITLQNIQATVKYLSVGKSFSMTTRVLLQEENGQSFKILNATCNKRKF